MPTNLPPEYFEADKRYRAAKTPAEKIVVAVPTGYEASLDALKEQVDDVYCPNVRGGWGFAVGDAYRHWGKVWDTDAEKIVSRFAA